MSTIALVGIAAVLGLTVITVTAILAVRDAIRLIAQTAYVGSQAGYRWNVAATWAPAPRGAQQAAAAMAPVEVPRPREQAS
jgi:hypothetical protein